ncbi:hypothetical protein [Catenuloplanes japonicus]|uniref:hypothetical protein n=1 Tax=Catenuloplanes japonicus TaxID=33876 RepID=UPI0005241CAA|nr:hypothetical protein [Catenuloplanes japonicus]
MTEFIDLDAPETAAPRPPRARVVLAVIALAVAAAGGAAWGHDRARAQRRALDEATVALAVVPGRPGETGGNLLHAQVTGVITLINAGPLPVEIRTFQGAGAGITLTGIDRRRRIDPGVASGMQAVAVVDCNPGVPLTPLQLDVWVRTVDDVARETQLPLGLKGSAWDDAVSVACSPR